MPRLSCLCLGAVLALAGCSAPPPAQIDGSVPQAWTQPLPASTAAAPDLHGWWKAWGDKTLDALVEEALAANLDLAQAQSRLRQQRLLAGTSDAAYRPVVTAGVRTLQDIAAIDSYFHASIDVAWDLGLFGAREAGLQSAAAGVLDAAGRLQAARVALVADVAHRYLDIRMAQRQRALLDEQVRIDARALQLAEVRRAQRLGTQDAVQQLRLQSTQILAQQAAVREAQARAAHGLAALLGRTRPDAQWLGADAGAPLPGPDALAVAALPADLLRTRPDIQVAQAGVERAAAELGLARSALYPRFVIAGSLLYSYNITQNLRTTQDNAPTFGPQIDIPLFDWSRRRSQADASELALQASVQAYRQSVLDGVAEVESALAALAAQRERIAALQASGQVLEQRGQAQERRQALGLDSEFGGLAGRRAALQARSEQATALAAHALAYVALYKALGGAPLPPEDKDLGQDAAPAPAVPGAGA
ncbi:Cation efflux system protein CusC precursor [Delftia tsuruhatensis]|uniref:TolC family protein n=1 Tax=Delftia tsuruhatensis TaxID=180282 RepID=UPI001E7AD257|nr:TolC family protein [Delftia tsuruhatensis]CAB5681318.1 Cation efflux system protein CusC precursor [Delftia tsuruhatensis]CAC9675662.1 Cation efflux system protein CusC precursor [Delftia tsuruhatensis]